MIGIVISVVFFVCVVLYYVVTSKSHQNMLLEKDAQELRMQEQLYRIAVSHSSKHVLRADIKSRSLRVEDDFFYGVAPGTVLNGLPDVLLNSDLLDESSRDAVLLMYENIESGHESGECTVTAKNKDGAYTPFRVMFTSVFDDKKLPKYAIITYEDITEARQREIVYERWRRSVEQMPYASFRLIEHNLTRDYVESAEGGLFDAGHIKGIMNYNEKIGYFIDEFVFPADVDRFAAVRSREALIACYHDGKRDFTVEFRLFEQDKPPKWVRLTIQLIEYMDSTDIKAYKMYVDIDDEKRKEMEMKARSEQDPLTGALNRAAFKDAVGAILETSSQNAQHCFMLIDLDHLKLINDTLGHSEGDNALISMVSGLRALLRQEDIIGRLGGDEFVVFLPNITSDDVIEKRASQIVLSMRRTVSAGLKTSCSVGVSVYPRDAKDYDDLYICADRALYTIKETTRDDYAFYSRAKTEKGKDETSLFVNAGRQARRRTVLIVDDSAADRALLQKALCDTYHVHMAEDGAAALRLLRRYGSGISMVLLDLHMPNMNGFELLAYMKNSKELSIIPVMIVSADHDNETKLNAFRTGIFDYITKPYDMSTVLVKIETALIKSDTEKARLRDSYEYIRHEEETRYRNILESTETIVIEVDMANAEFKYENDISNHLLGRYHGKAFWDALSEYDVTDEETIRLIQNTVVDLYRDTTGNDKAALDIHLKSKMGELRWYRMKAIKVYDDDHVSRRILLTLNDANEEILYAQKIGFMAEYDELTGLLSRTAFIRKAGELLAEAPVSSYSMLYFDIDRFKRINELYGHREGDKLLRFVADVVDFSAGDGSLSCHVGADTFAALVRYDTEFKYKQLINDVRRAVANYPTVKSIIINFGVYVIDEPNLAPNIMMDRAAIAQKSVKGGVEGHTAFYDQPFRQKESDEKDIIDNMHGALKRGEFLVYYQPQVDLKTGYVSGVEALVRWQHPTRGLLLPGAFIGLFEKNGFIAELDRYVWRRTLQDMALWRASGHSLVPCSVNMSRIDMYNKELCQEILSMVDEYGVPIELFNLEITESTFGDIYSNFAQEVNRFREAGFIVHMDDFGSGYSSLNLLKDITVDALKLDLRFLVGGDTGGRGSVILKSVVDMAESLGLGTIAEGVETEEQAEFLRSIGCKNAQGFLFCRPLSREALENALLKSIPLSECR